MSGTTESSSGTSNGPNYGGRETGAQVDRVLWADKANDASVPETSPEETLPGWQGVDADVEPGSTEPSGGPRVEAKAPPAEEWSSAGALASRPLPEPAQPSGDRRGASPYLIGAGLLAVLIIAAIGYALLGGTGDDDTATDGAATEESAEADGRLVSETSAGTIEEIRDLLDGIGYSDITVEERDGAIHLGGEVAAQSDLAAVVAAATSMANGLPIDSSGLAVVEPAPAGPDAGGATAVVVADPLQRLQVRLHRMVAAAPIIFEPTVSGLSDWHEPTLDRVAAALLANPGIAINIVGYTDQSGSTAENQALSLDRANAVRDYLVDRGIQPGLLQVEARGESEASDLRDLYYLERRVEFEVVAASLTPPAIKPLDVGIIVPSPGDDLAFSQSLVDALDVLGQERGGLNVTVTENMFVPEEGRDQARQYAEDGADVVILHGAQFVEFVEELATDHPEVVFVAGPDAFETDLPNVFIYTVAAEQGAFVLGDLAASMSESKTIGIIGPLPVPEPQLYVDGFTLGAEAGGATVMSEYVGSFNDADAGAAVAEGFIEDGADVLTGTSQLTVGPIGVAEREGVLWFANQANQQSLAPDRVVASQVYHFEVAIREILAEIDANSTSGGTFPLTLGNGGLLLEFNPDVSLASGLRTRVDELLLGVAAGSVDIPVDVEVMDTDG